MTPKTETSNQLLLFDTFVEGGRRRIRSSREDESRDVKDERKYRSRATGMQDGDTHIRFHDE